MFMGLYSNTYVLHKYFARLKCYHLCSTYYFGACALCSKCHTFDETMRLVYGVNLSFLIAGISFFFMHHMHAKVINIQRKWRWSRRKRRVDEKQKMIFFLNSKPRAGKCCETYKIQMLKLSTEHAAHAMYMFVCKMSTSFTCSAKKFHRQISRRICNLRCSFPRAQIRIFLLPM